MFFSWPIFCLLDLDRENKNKANTIKQNFQDRRNNLEKISGRATLCEGQTLMLFDCGNIFHFQFTIQPVCTQSCYFLKQTVKLSMETTLILACRKLSGKNFEPQHVLFLGDVQPDMADEMKLCNFERDSALPSSPLHSDTALE